LALLVGVVACADGEVRRADGETGLWASDSDSADTDPRDSTVEDSDPGVDTDPADTDTAEPVVDPAEVPWEVLGLGVSYKALPDRTGEGAMVLYGGWKAQDDWVQRWLDELYRRRLRDLGVGHLYAVRGPLLPDYADREIQNSRLARHLVAAGGDSPVWLVAHSSGSFVAHELVGQLAGPLDPDRVTAGRLRLINLDGGGSGLTTALAADLADLRFVLAEDGVGASANAATMRALARTYTAPLVVVDARDAGCTPGARWCLHDAVVTSRPHNATTYDLERDYTRFGADRVPITVWLEP
jgi:hypothetical protein